MLNFVLVLGFVALSLCCESFMHLLEVLAALESCGPILRILVFDIIVEFCHDTTLFKVHAIQVIVYSVEACNDSTSIIQLPFLLLIVHHLFDICFTALGYILLFFQALHVHNDANDGLGQEGQ